ncbi:hypothetical protein EF294_14120 [Gordonia oryzae]|uniref:Uncharacterized protein n=1 Tax=Gordonia oryzae TaxID=2487349 RepID=A0A3N4GII4_9ACTN|nr:hypothetical protein [Gordonia oryzae]RPA58971.1 hypothetical protein EF294_14120 [Gordonia oryzae]
MTSTAMQTLADLTEKSGLGVLDHLDTALPVPVTTGLQAQGDLLVVPWRMVAPEMHTVRWSASSASVPRAGIELLRSAGGGNPHTLLADGACTWTQPHFVDDVILTLGVIDASSVAYLLHPEHGASGIAPGRYVIRRQREAAEELYGLSWFGRSGRVGGSRLVAD